MNGFKKLLTTRFLSAAMLFSGVVAQAMPFQQFDHMAAQDRQDYMDYLVDSAQKVLVSQGRADDAAKVYQLFNEIHPGDHLSIGEAEFEGNLANARVRDAEKAAQNPNAPRVQVESALTGTLKKNGIELTLTSIKVLSKWPPTSNPNSRPLSFVADENGMLLFALVEIHDGRGDLAHQVAAVVCRLEIEFEGQLAKQVQSRPGSPVQVQDLIEVGTESRGEGAGGGGLACADFAGEQAGAVVVGQKLKACRGLR